MQASPRNPLQKGTFLQIHLMRFISFAEVFLFPAYLVAMVGIFFLPSLFYYLKSQVVVGCTLFQLRWNLFPYWCNFAAFLLQTFFRFFSSSGIVQQSSKKNTSDLWETRRNRALKAPLKPRNTTVLLWSEGFQSTFNWVPILQRDASLSDSYTPISAAERTHGFCYARWWCDKCNWLAIQPACTYDAAFWEHFRYQFWSSFWVFFLFDV